MSLSAEDRRTHDIAEILHAAGAAYSVADVLEQAWRAGYSKGHDDGFDEGLSK